MNRRQVLFAMVFFTASVRSAELEIEVLAGPHDRRDTPVRFAVDRAAAGVLLVEVTAKGDVPVPVQLEAMEDAVHALWILQGETKRDAKRSYRLRVLEKAPIGAPTVRVIEETGKTLEVRMGDLPVLRYNLGKVSPPDPVIPAIQGRNAYLHPLWSPSGAVLTMDYPRNHLHHRGVWFPWVHTEFEGRHPDFWNLGDGTGTVEFAALDGVTSGPVMGGFRAKHRHVDLKAPGGPKTALEEIWTVRVWAVGGREAGTFLYDLESVQNCASASPLKLDQYRYGGLGLRGSWDWEGDAVRFFTSEGKGRLNGEDTPARWVDMGGPFSGRWAGITVLGHPKNFRAPQPVRIHPSEPFLNFSPVKSGPMAIEPGKPYVSRYRFALHDGVLRADEAERLWFDYAEPPVVRIKG